MSKKKTRIVFTGGGTAGHVTPNIPLIEALKKKEWDIIYIGSTNGIEKNIINSLSVTYKSIQTGKLRRYFSFKNILDPFKILFGVMQAFWLIYRIKPLVVFSKGGFVAFPVVVGAWLNRVPIVAHESDLSPGLANRLSFPFVDRICVTFAEARKHFKQQDKVVVTGTPIREQLLKGNKHKGLNLCGFHDSIPTVLIMGGSQGSSFLNQCVREALELLQQQFQIIHLCGPGKVDEQLAHHSNYFQLAYASHELADLYAACDIVISRAGANTIYELLNLGKPHILIPLSRKASRGDQIQNAAYFNQKGSSVVIEEEELSPQKLVDTLYEVMHNLEGIQKTIKSMNIDSATSAIIKQITNTGQELK